MWLTEFRARYGMTIGELGAYIRRLGARRVVPLRVSDILIERLETEPNFRTVPKLANLIAEACGATARQRDMLVLKRYRGTWKPTGRPTPAAAGPVPATPDCEGRAVVCVDRVGDEIRRFASVVEAARCFSCSSDPVGRRCRRQIMRNEFGMLGVTFRFADEWDRMSPRERREDLTISVPKAEAAQKAKDRRGGPRKSSMVPVTVITWDGKVRHYRSVSAAAEATNTRTGTVSKRITRVGPIRNGFCDGAVFIRTEVWEKMTDAQRQALMPE